jgi:hypothetical protein
MNDEKILLPDFLIAELYKDALVDLGVFSLHNDSTREKENQLKMESSLPDAGKIRFLGENRKKLTIIATDVDAIFLKEDDLAFLINILKACHLTLADIAIINMATHDLHYDQIKQQLDPLNILLFDVEPSSIRLPFLVPVFQLQKFDNRTIMVAPPLTALNKPNAEGKLLKTKLWLSLKQMFNIS